MEEARHLKAGMGFLTTTIYLCFVTFTYFRLQRCGQSLDCFMKATIILIGAACLLANYVDLAKINGWPVAFGSISINWAHDLFFPMFLGILIDQTRLALIVMTLRDPLTIGQRKKWALGVLGLIILFFLTI